MPKKTITTPPLDIINNNKQEDNKVKDKPLTFSLRPVKEALELMRARHNSVAHWEGEVKMYERFRDSDPINGHRRWQGEVRKAKQQLKRVIALEANVNGKPDSNS